MSDFEPNKRDERDSTDKPSESKPQDSSTSSSSPQSSPERKDTQAPSSSPSDPRPGQPEKKPFPQSQSRHPDQPKPKHFHQGKPHHHKSSFHKPHHQHNKPHQGKPHHKPHVHHVSSATPSHSTPTHTKPEEDVIKLKVPSFNNPWMVAAIVLAVILLVVLFTGFSFNATGNVVGGSAIGEDAAADNVIAFLNENAPSEVTLQDVSQESGLYRVDVLFQGQTVPVYVTQDGQFLVSSLQPLGAAPAAGLEGDTTVGETQRVDVSFDDDAVEGDSNAPVTIVEFSDYECPFCGRFYAETLPQIRENYIETGDVKLVFRDFPLNFHPMAQPAAEAAECVKAAAEDAGEDADEEYFIYHDTLFENQQSLSEENLIAWANDQGYDIEECLTSGEMSAEVQKDLAEGQQYGISGTPGFFVNGQKIEGAQPYSVFEQAIEAALAEAQ